MRKYKSGSRWAFWRWTEVPSGYITRLHVLKTPWFAVMVHWLNHPDPEPYLHDHPVSFLSLILRGSYCEVHTTNRPGNAVRTADGSYVVMTRRAWFNWVPYHKRHTIVAVAPRTTTLCFNGPARQVWGYYTPEGKISWKDYVQEQR